MRQGGIDESMHTLWAARTGAHAGLRARVGCPRARTPAVHRPETGRKGACVDMRTRGCMRACVEVRARVEMRARVATCTRVEMGTPAAM